jgi:hypothetical protein
VVDALARGVTSDASMRSTGHCEARLNRGLHLLAAVTCLLISFAAAACGKSQDAEALIATSAAATATVEASQPRLSRDEVLGLMEERLAIKQLNHNDFSCLVYLASIVGVVPALLDTQYVGDGHWLVTSRPVNVWGHEDVILTWNVYERSRIVTSHNSEILLNDRPFIC